MDQRPFWDGPLESPSLELKVLPELKDSQAIPVQQVQLEQRVLKALPVQRVLKAIPEQRVLKAIPEQRVLKAIPVQPELKAIPVQPELKEFKG